MPWKEVSPMEETMKCVSLVLSGQYTVKELAEQFSVSRKTIHKWVRRYQRLATRIFDPMATFGIAADYAVASVYIYLSNGQWYVGQTRQYPGKRKKQHEALKKILIKSFDPFCNNRHISKRKLDVLERYLFDLLEQELPGESSNRKKPLGDKNIIDGSIF